MGTSRPPAVLLRWLPEGRRLPDPVWRRRHRFLVLLALTQAATLVVVGLVQGRGVSHSLLEGAAVGVPALPALVPALGRPLRASATTASLVLASAVLVHLSGGLTEAHFHFFVMVGAVSLYQDWVPFGVALAIVVAHHGLLGTLHPEGVYGTAQARAHPWLWALIHGGFVLASSLTHLAAWRHNEQQFLTDPLTDLPNRTWFSERLTRELALAPQGQHAVLLVDLDDFRLLNDGRGTEVGDAVLRAAATRLQGCLRRSQLLARLGGDEFAVLVPDARDASAVGTAIIECFAEPFVLDGQDLVVRASVGLAGRGSGGAGADGEELVRNADLALSLAKAQGKGRLAVYASEMSEQWRERSELLEDLAGARAAGELEVHYQATVDLPRGRVQGYEALLRWRHPERGLVPPLDFIPLAEQSGAILELGEFVLAEAVRQVGEWSASGAGELEVAVNVSPRQLADAGFAGYVESVLSATGFPPARLLLEVTEGVLVEDLDSVIRRLAQLRALGVRVAIDDFGTGYSSLSHLRRLPVDVVKIDRSFVRDMVGSPSAAALVATILELARNLGLDVIAEGVESEAQSRALAALDCPRAQGFLWARPLSAAELDAAGRAPAPAPSADGDRTPVPHPRAAEPGLATPRT